MSEKVKSLSRL